MSTDLYNDVFLAVSECFATDVELIKKWHIGSGSGLNACIDRTMNDVAKYFDSSFRFYKVYERGELAGYWGTEFGKYLNLIFVKPKFRNSDFLNNFWHSIKESVSNPFTTAIYAKNKPAISFYIKHGKIIDNFQMDGNEVVLFEFNKDKV